jgi:hypothetical protein
VETPLRPKHSLSGAGMKDDHLIPISYGLRFETWKKFMPDQRLSLLCNIGALLLDRRKSRAGMLHCFFDKPSIEENGEFQITMILSRAIPSLFLSLFSKIAIGQSKMLRMEISISLAECTVY